MSISKLFAIEIKGDSLMWFSSYIENREQAVVINNYISSWMEGPSGVPKGFFTGSLLFLIFINDIYKCWFYSRFCFADDIKVFAKIGSADDVIKTCSQIFQS